MSTEAVTAKAVFEAFMGFKRTGLLRTALDLALFDVLAAGPRPVADVARALATDARSTGFLLEALATQGWIVRTGPDYQLAPGAAELLVTSSPRYCGGIARVAASYGEWEVFGRLTETVRSGRPIPDVDAWAPNFDYWVDFATAATFATGKGAELVAEQVAPRLGERADLSVLDAGCGSGAFGFELAQRHPSARLLANDWPTVLDVTAGHAKARGLAERTTLLPGDIFTAELGGPHDVIVAGNLLFLFPAERAAALVERFAAALKPGGQLAIVSFMVDGPPAASEHAHLLNLLMMSWTAGGEILSPSAYSDLARSAGLVDVEVHERAGLPLKLVLAGKPA